MNLINKAKTADPNGNFEQKFHQYKILPNFAFLTALLADELDLEAVFDANVEAELDILRREVKERSMNTNTKAKPKVF